MLLSLLKVIILRIDAFSKNEDFTKNFSKQNNTVNVYARMLN